MHLSPTLQQLRLVVRASCSALLLTCGLAGADTYHAVELSLPQSWTGGWNVTAINDQGLMAGSFVSAQSPIPLLWRFDGNSVHVEALPSSGTPWDINASGQIVGMGRAGPHGSVPVAMMWTGTTPTGVPLPVPTVIGPGGNPVPWTPSSANGVNDAGQVVGGIQGQGAVVWNGSGSWATLPGLDHAADIGNQGQVIGSSQGRAVVWNQGQITALGTLGGAGSQASAINNTGQIAGSAEGNGFTHAVVWNGTVATDLGALPGDSYSTAADINNQGLAVGMSGTLGNPLGHPVLWDGHGIIDLNSALDPGARDSGLVLTSAIGINDSGWIVANASRPAGANSLSVGVLLIPTVPEPGSFALMASGLGLMFALARRRLVSRDAALVRERGPQTALQAA